MRELSEQEIVRRNKVEEIRKVCNPYPERYEITHRLHEAVNLPDGEKNVRVAGRIVFMRKMGKLSFLRIRDLEGSLQVSIKIDLVGEEKYAFFKSMIDVGDFIGVEGEMFTTQTGEKTLRADDFTFLGKALRPLPEKFHGLTDIEDRYRERYVDLISNEDSRKVFLGRSKLYSFLHRYLGENGLAKCFRNEGMDTEHLQEFTQVEWYASYWNYEDNLKFYQNFIRNLMMELVGTTTITYQGNTLDFGKDFTRINYVEKLREILGFDFLEVTDPSELKEKIVATGLFSMADLEEYHSISQIIDFVYKKTIRAGIVEPTVIYNYPAVLIPLARRNDKDKRIIDVFQVVAGGTELCKAYSELVDPIVQRQAFEDQLIAKSQGDDETMEIDEGFLGAMEQGMPPISGLGFGIDRLLMLIYDVPSIRDVVLFPLMKQVDNK